MQNTQQFRAALVQMRSKVTTSPNLDMADRFIREAAKDGAEYVLTPENTSLMELRTKPLFEKIESEENSKALLFFTHLAKELKIWLHIGAIPVRLTETKAANRSYLINPNGTISAKYDKIHMFDVELPNGENYLESKNFKAGNQAVVTDLPWGKLGLTICYDLRFPNLYRALAKAGAKIISVPAAFTLQTGRAHWHILLRSRAIETGCFIFAAAQGGDHETGRSTYGHSMIISPWGEILAEADTEPGWICTEINMENVEKARNNIPSLQHDREFDLTLIKSDMNILETP